MRCSGGPRRTCEVLGAAPAPNGAAFHVVRAETFDGQHPTQHGIHAGGHR